MKVVLQKDIKDVGKVGDIISVKPGYARNFLFPRKLAFNATKNTIRQKAHYESLIKQKSVKVKKQRAEILEKVSQESLQFDMQTNEEGQLFGSVTSLDISKKLSEKGYQIGRKDIVLTSPLKTLGEHEINISLGPDQTTSLKILLKNA